MEEMHMDMDKKERESLVQSFLQSLGSVIRTKRNKKNFSVIQLGEYLGVSGATVSRYENGKQEIPVSYLPLISAYCQFPLIEYFVNGEAQKLVNTFSELINIDARMKYKKKQKALKKPQKIIKGYIYEEDGKEYIKYRTTDVETLYDVDTDLKRKYKYSAMETPFTASELEEYFDKEENADICVLLNSAQILLENSQEKRGHTALREEIAKFTIDSVIQKVAERDKKSADRIILYYRMLLKREMNEE